MHCHFAKNKIWFGQKVTIISVRFQLLPSLSVYVANAFNRSWGYFRRDNSIADDKKPSTRKWMRVQEQREKAATLATNRTLNALY